MSSICTGFSWDGSPDAGLLLPHPPAIAAAPASGHQIERLTRSRRHFSPHHPELSALLPAMLEQVPHRAERINLPGQVTEDAAEERSEQMLDLHTQRLC
eukprot:760327-Hanusia_phi.AAC.8